METLLNRYRCLNIHYRVKYNIHDNTDVDEVAITVKSKNIVRIYKQLSGLLKHFAKIKPDYSFKVKLNLRIINSSTSAKQLIYSLGKLIDSHVWTGAVFILSYRNVRIVKSSSYEYLTTSRSYSNLHFLLSEYTMLGKSSNNTNFYNSLTRLHLCKSKKQNLSIKFPVFSLNEYLTNEELFDTKLIPLSVMNFETICFNLVYKCSKYTSGIHFEHEYQTCEDSVLYIIDSVFKRFKMNVFLVITICLVNIDETFNLDRIVSHIGDVYSQSRRRFVITIKAALIYKYTYCISELGQNVFINKTICKVNDYNTIFAFFYVIKTKLRALNRNFIKVQLAKFLINYKYFDFDRVDGGGGVAGGFPIELEQFNHIENNEISKLLILSNNYTPIK
jgi:hypothetical protein